MKIIVSQQNLPAQAGKKLLITFKSGKVVDNYAIDKADEFLVAIDKFISKRRISPINLIGQIRHIEFHNTGILTERVIRSTMLGLRFPYKLAQNCLAARDLP